MMRNMIISLLSLHGEALLSFRSLTAKSTLYGQRFMDSTRNGGSST